ncbi:hypothetical protein [Microbacterium lacticum]|nr:hypothetical protein [Microbacterium lacticum]
MTTRQIIIEGTAAQLTAEVVGQILATAALAGAVADVQDVD